MKFLTKAAFVAITVLITAPAIAGEGPVKGTKSYQAARFEKPAQQTQANMQEPQTAEQAAQMAPAAGDTKEPQDAARQVKTMREQMKLPRKN